MKLLPLLLFTPALALAQYTNDCGQPTATNKEAHS